MSDSIPSTSSTSASWSTLPNEMKAQIVQNVDLLTGLTLKKCGGIQGAVVQTFASFDVFVEVTYPRKDLMTIDIIDANENNIVQQWLVHQDKKGSVVFSKLNDETDPIYRSNQKTSMPKTTFQIVGRLLTDRMFCVKKLKLSLNNYKGIVNFNLNEIVEIGMLVIDECHFKYTIRSILENETIETDKWVIHNLSKKNLNWTDNAIRKIVDKRELENMEVGNNQYNTFLYCPHSAVESILKYHEVDPFF